MVSPRVAASFRRYLPQRRVLQWLQRGPLLWHGPVWASTVVHCCPIHRRQPNCCSVPGAHPALLLHWPWGLQGHFSHVFSLLSPSCYTAFFTLNKCFTEALPVLLTDLHVTCGESVVQSLCPTQSYTLSHRSHLCRHSFLPKFWCGLLVHQNVFPVSRN